MSYVSKLDTPLLRLSPTDNFTLRDACAGVHIFGGIGSGKTSGSGKVLAGAYLRAGMGGLVLCAKSEEVALWQEYAAAHGRRDSVVLFDERQGFNFLSYELARQGMEGIGTVTDCLMKVLEACEHATGKQVQGSGDPFWDKTIRQVLRYTIPPLYAARGTVTVSDIIDFLTSAPADSAQIYDTNWQAQSFMFSIMQWAEFTPKIPIPKENLLRIIDYWCNQYPAIPEKTRGNIVISVTAELDRFKHGRLEAAFCGKTTIVPELCFHGAIIIMAMPALTWNEDGIIGQQVFKYMWQRAVLSRNSLHGPWWDRGKHRNRPVFLWADEAQYFVNSYDAEYQSTCRASRACTVFLTQSLPTYTDKMGGDKSHTRAHALVGKFMTSIFHSNACPDTNEWASKTIGKALQRRFNESEGEGSSMNMGMNKGDSINSGYSSNSSSSHGPGGQTSSLGSGSSSGKSQSTGENLGRGQSRNTSRGYTEVMDFLIEPGDFGRILKTGGPDNGYRVTGVWYQAGRAFKANGYNILVASFRQ